MKAIRCVLPLMLLVGAVPLTHSRTGRWRSTSRRSRREVKLKEKAHASSSRAAAWSGGYAGNHLVVTTLNKQYVGPTINQLTRFGTNASTVAAGG